MSFNSVKKYNFIYQITNKCRALYQVGTNHFSTNQKHIYKNIEGEIIKRRVNIDKLEDYKKDGWIVGCFMSEQHRKNLSLGASKANRKSKGELYEI